MKRPDLLDAIDAHFERPADQLGDQARADFEAFLELLEQGEVRAAYPTAQGWVVEPSVKRGILLGFRLGKNVEMGGADLQFSDKDTYPAQRLDVVGRSVRVVPGGSSVRRGAYMGERVTMMPPAFVNVGAYVGAGSMVDSHALVGSCAQIGERVHLSAGAQIGGVLEPIGQTPVIVEDDALIGGNTGLYEGVQVGERAVIGAGCVITASTPIFDLVREEVYRATAEEPLKIPAGAVVIPGSRPARGDFAREHGLHMAALLIIKYRDDRTDARSALEDLLR
ncbi:2,3,4,5-tetrahydropyridine-2,6-dicarboxylate N-succinyltransferase [Lujinxingia litoralis]|uniref:2,3,4,5-tetrahydropyridine-2,6-dicarboxylate N-succinyltransferase n=1 Tax=Lujinxingia litoralis TaxID=2211119 RepID=A0A328CBE0_9DELT|nr:2,3,4,5-tetrahydropyridine-2,6-dicarboxylate N-succinyltransferase [Lujinxingia litoralis]RAL24870.1 2,3,4,5-tetrahydropyridine-2,6-dicarboxylate N-succinyltransferase [Lujinxingia litoralis]